MAVRRSAARRSHDTTTGNSVVWFFSASNRRAAPRRTTISTTPDGCSFFAGVRRRGGRAVFVAISAGDIGPAPRFLQERFHPPTRSGFILQSVSLTRALYISSDTDRFEYVQETTNSAFSSCHSALVTVHSNVVSPLFVVSMRESPGFGRAGTLVRRVNLIAALSILVSRSPSDRTDSEGILMLTSTSIAIPLFRFDVLRARPLGALADGEADRLPLA